MTRRLYILVFAAVVVACGITEPQYIDYSDDDTVKDAGGSGTGSAGSPACVAALDEFSAQIEPALEKTCITSRCHVEQTIGATTMKKGDAAGNRDGVKRFSAGSAEKFFNKLSKTGVGHGGGDQGAALPKANVDAWIAKEAACP